METEQQRLRNSSVATAITHDDWMLKDLRCSLVTNGEVLCCSKQWRADWSEQVWPRPCPLVDETYVNTTQSPSKTLFYCIMSFNLVLVFIFWDIFFGKSNFQLCLSVISTSKVHESQWHTIPSMHFGAWGGSVVQHCVSSAKGCGFNSQWAHILIKTCIAWMHCKSL